MTVMPLDAAEEVATEPLPPTKRRGLPRFLKTPGGIFGAAWLTFMIVASLTAPLWRPYEPNEQDTANRLALPSAEHWLGTDPVGRDLLSRIFVGGAQPLICAACTAMTVPIAGSTCTMLTLSEPSPFTRAASTYSRCRTDWATPSMIR